MAIRFLLDRKTSESPLCDGHLQRHNAAGGLPLDVPAGSVDPTDLPLEKRSTTSC